MAEETKELITCPCCGKPTLEKPIKVKQEDLDRYIASITTGEPYSKSYILHKGAVRVTVCNLDELTKDKMNLLVSRTNAEEDEALKGAQQLFIVRLFTLLPVTCIEVAGEQECKKDIKALTTPLLQDALEHYKEKDWLDKAYSRLMDPSEVTGLSKTVIDKVVAKHLENYTLLTDSGFDADFFDGIVQG